MACSVCRQTGHKKPNCPVVKEEAKENRQQLITILQTIPLILANPLFQAFIWLELSKRNQNVNLLNNLIATAEVVPTIDLNVPKGVVLGAMLDKTEDTIDIFNDIKTWLFDFEVPDLPTKEETIEGAFATADILGTIGRNPFVEAVFPTWSDIFKETDKASDIAQEEFERRQEEGTLYMTDEQYAKWLEENRYKTYTDGDSTSYSYD
jgi:hypothetical protein